MKRVTLLVPDSVMRVLGSSSHSTVVGFALDDEKLRRVLEESGSYHERWFFKPGSTRVVSVEDVDSEEVDGGERTPASTDR
ncbi:MAG: hypothetical protein JXR83_01270 [Deltaproteobacteria bacterium]|nr:hypothetical protein [Deltaproteobacteria bacterium]